jgi:hypothetical protein
MLNRPSRVALAIAVLTAGSGLGFADDTRKAPDPTLDDELLEFLGSVDTVNAASDDSAWIEYLSETDIGKVAAKPDNPTVVAVKPTAPPNSSASGAKQNE